MELLLIYGYFVIALVVAWRRMTDSAWYGHT